MQTNEKIKILIVGNGFGGVYALKNLHKMYHKNPNIELSIIGDKNYFLFTPLLHEVATGGINRENIVEPIRDIIGCCLNNFYLGKAELINLKDKTVKVNDLLITYDYLILAPGSETNFYNTNGAQEHSLTLKGIDDAIKIKNQVIDMLELASQTKEDTLRKNMLRFVIVGAGPTGVELAGELDQMIKETLVKKYNPNIIDDISIILVNKGPEIMAQFGQKMRNTSTAYLNKRGIKIMSNMGVTEVGENFILLDNGDKIESNNIFWVAGVKPRELNFNTKVKKFADNRIIVNEYLQLDNHTEVFAFGDNATFTSDKYPKGFPQLAQVAEKQADVVAQNIHNTIAKINLEKFSYNHSGDLISLGRFMAIGEIFGFTISGFTTWWLWRTIYLYKLISWRKKFEVALDWTIDLFSGRDISKI